jgi:hypothetical protein
MKQYIIFDTFSIYQRMSRIITDEILETSGKWKNTGDIKKVGKQAAQELNHACLLEFSLIRK